ncbi:MAG TPA: ubiquitin-like domain-containing protein [Candidatus Saccharimonadia bacterium]|nr:ubiquitin-like domain-containing protein [Candidatus Saccharimonadia bacterium]
MRHGISHIIATYQKLRAQPRNLLAIGLLLAIVSLGPSSGRLPVTPAAAADSQALISLYADGQQRLFSADDKTVGDVLRRANLKLGPHDLVEPSAASPVPHGQFNINVYRARPVLVEDGLQTYRLKSAYQSPRLLALAAGLVVYPEDRFHTEIITDFVDDGSVGEKVTVTRAKPVNVKVDGQQRIIRTQAGTAVDALKGAGVALGVNDTVSVNLAAPVTSGMTVSITRVTEAVVNLTQTLPKPVKVITDPTVLKGQTSIKDPGADGQKTVTYRIHYHDGVETVREAIQTVSQTAPVAKVVVQGSKVFFAGSVEYWRSQAEAAATANGIDPNMLLRIMNCESRGNATSVSAFTIGGEHPTGLFQFLPSTWRAAGGTNDNIFDGSLQIQIAAKKMAREGTKAWQCK